MDFLRRSFYTLRTCPDKWSGEQWERINILFEEFPELKEAFDLKEEFRKLYWSKRDKEELKDKMPAPEERNAFGGNRRGEPARMVRPCKEKQVA